MIDNKAFVNIASTFPLSIGYRK